MEKKVIVVTGGNRGIGKEICRQLGALGHTVVLAGRDLASAENAADEMSGDVRAYKLDVRNPQSIEKFAEKMKADFKAVDVLVNNAGIMGRSAMKNFDLNEIQVVTETNYWGPIRVTKALMPLIQASASGRIVNMSSGMGQTSVLPEGGFASYRLSKAGLNNFTILLAAELKDQGIAVNAMCPGWVRTDMGGLTADRSVSEGADTAVWLATAEEVPTGKMLRDRKEIEW